MTFLHHARKGLFWILTLSVAFVSLRFVTGGVEETMAFVAYHATERGAAFFAHITLGPLALALLPFQFNERQRRKRPGVHRWMGRVYAMSILLAGVGGLAMALGTRSGSVASTGFALLAVFWLITTGVAVWHAMNKRISGHRAWMIRSAALTFSAVTLRLEMPLLMMGFGDALGYTLVAWTCWVPNLLIAEWLLRRKRPAAQIA